MYIRHVVSEIILGCSAIVLAGLLLRSGFWEMSSVLEMCVVAILVVVVAVLGGLVWKERPEDEREEYHRMFVDRFAFIVGLICAVVLILKQSLEHALQKDVLLILIAMIVAKVAAMLYVQRRR